MAQIRVLSCTKKKTQPSVVNWTRSFKISTDTENLTWFHLHNMMLDNFIFNTSKAIMFGSREQTGLSLSAFIPLSVTLSFVLMTNRCYILVVIWTGIEFPTIYRKDRIAELCPVLRIAWIWTFGSEGGGGVYLHSSCMKEWVALVKWKHHPCLYF